MKVNPVKCHLRIVSTSQSELKIVDEIIKSNTCEKLLGIESDNKLRLNAHVRTYAKIVTPYMTVSKRRVLINDFFKLQFSCCPVLGMCYSWTLNNKKTDDTKGALESSKGPSIQNLLNQNRSLSVCTLNLQTRVIEMYKVS